MDWRSLFLLLLPRLSENTYSSFQLPVATHFSWRSCSWSCIEYLLWYNHNYGVVSVGYFSSRERLVSPSDRRSQTGTLAQKLDFKLNCKGNEKAQTTWGLGLGISRHCTSGERGDKGSDWEKRNVYWSVCGENLRFLGFGFFFFWPLLILSLPPPVSCSFPLSCPTLYVYVCTHAPQWVCMWELYLGYHSSGSNHLGSWHRGFFHRCQSICLGWVFGKPQRSTCLCLPSTGDFHHVPPKPVFIHRCWSTEFIHCLLNHLLSPEK